MSCMRSSRTMSTWWRSMSATTAPPTNKGLRFPAEPLTQTETARLLAAVPTRSTSGLRLRALVAVMYGAGLRVQEAVYLMPGTWTAARCVCGGARAARR